jgi:hypothetical protein
MITHISQSLLNRWLMCGEWVRRNYFEGDGFPSGVHAKVGSAVHRAVELHNRDRIRGGCGLCVSDMQDAARDAYMNMLRDEGIFIARRDLPDANTIMQKGLDLSIRAAARYRTDYADTYTPLGAEEVLEADIGWGIPLRGVIDIREKKIRDVKVHFRKRAQDWADSNLQPTVYTYLHKVNYGYAPDFLYDQIVAGINPKAAPLTTSRNKPDYEMLFRIIGYFMNDMRAGVFRPAAPGHWLCSEKWCCYHETCSYIHPKTVVVFP